MILLVEIEYEENEIILLVKGLTMRYLSAFGFLSLFFLIPRIPNVIAVADFSLGRKLSTFATSLLVHLGRTCA